MCVGNVSGVIPRKRGAFVSKSTRVFLTVLVSVAFWVPSATAQEQNAESKTGVSVGNESIAYARLAGELALVADDTRDSVLMLAAAILDELAALEMTTRGKVNEGEGAIGEDKPAAGSLFELAEEYAGDNQSLLALIRDSMSRVATMKGRVHGAAVHVDRVSASGTDTFREIYRAKEIAEVCIVGDGDTDLDLFIYDENGNLICEDIGFTDRAYCNWTPRWEGLFEIVIENLGGVYNEYRLFTN